MNIFKFLFFTSVFFVKASYGAGLEPNCEGRYRYEFIKDVTVNLYNINGNSNRFSIRVSNSKTKWYQVTLSSSSSHFLYDMAKTARLTGEKVNICINPVDGWLVGMSWANSAN
jgi:hypothetical protein